MEQYNLSWTLWMQNMVLGKSWRHLKGGDDEQSQMFAIFSQSLGTDVVYLLMSRPTAPLCLMFTTLGGNPWKTITQYSSVPSDCGSSVCMCTHVHAWFHTHIHAWFQIKYVTRNKSYAKGKAWSWSRHDSFILNPKLGWSLADGHKHSHQSK